eukprot:gene14062-17095_t
MNYVEKLFDEVHYVFNLNAATLSGAIDILVIPQLDGTLKCTPFHVRFGKLQLISSSEKIVSIYVNNVKTDLHMKLGHAGEAFFVEETEEPVPTILATSPITSPKPGRASKTSTEELVSEFMDSRITMTTTKTSNTTTTTTTNNNNLSSSTSSTISSFSLNNSNGQLPLVQTTSPPSQQQQSSSSSKTPQSTTNSNSLDKKEMKPLTQAFEEMIISKQQQQQQQQQIKLPSPTSTTTTTTSLTAAATTTTTTTFVSSPIKRASSPVNIEGVDDITLDSPIGSYIINCESDSTPVNESPIGSPVKSTLKPNHALTTSTEIASDSESEPKFWLWGAFPKLTRRKKQQAPTTVTQQESHQQQQEIESNNTTMTTTTTTTSDTVLLIENQNDNHLIDNTSTTTTVETSPSSVENNGVTIYVPPHSSEIDINNSNTTPIEGGSSSWKRMGSYFSKKFNQSSTNLNNNAINSNSQQQQQQQNNMPNNIKVEPTFIIKPPTSILGESTSDGEMFLLDEEQEQIDNHNNNNDDNEEKTNLLLNNHNNDHLIPSFDQHQQKNHNQPQFDFEQEQQLQNHQTYASIAKQNITNDIINSTPIKGIKMEDSDSGEGSPSSQLMLDEDEYPSLTPRGTNINYKYKNNRKHQHQQQQQNGKIQNSDDNNEIVILLSLCGHLIQDRNLAYEPEEKEGFFKEYQITYEQLCSDPSLLKNPHLVAKINDQYYPWTVAGHVLLSHLVFKKPLLPEALELLKKKDYEERMSFNKTAKPSGWKSWWWKSSEVNKPSTANATNPVQNVSSPNNNILTTTPTTPSVTSPVIKPSSQQPQQQQLIPIPTSNSQLQAIADKKSFTKKSLRATSDQLKSLGLKKGANRITFSVSSTLQGTREVTATIYLWDNTSKIVISDIDGTITKSDVFGQVLPLIGKDWSHIGVAELYSNIKENGYQIIYLTSRAIGQADLTRTYISSVKQPAGPAALNTDANTSIHTLPQGPVFMSPNRLLTSFNREVIKRNPEEFKIACLQDIQNIFPPGSTPFYAGFGNRITDAIAYNAVGVSRGKTFTINALGVINTTNTTYNKTYTKLNDLVQDMFPYCHNESSGKHI